MAINIIFSENIQEFGYIIDVNIKEGEDLRKHEKLFLEHKNKLNDIVRRQGFVPIFNPIEIRHETTPRGYIMSAVYCVAGKVGKRLAKVVNFVKDEVELEKILKIAEDL